jgi:hypothetical protein
MRCRDFERLLNEQIDARDAPSAEVERALESHGSTCPACRAEAMRYHALRQAIAAWSSPPLVSADFTERFLNHWEHVRTEVEAEDTATPRILRLWPGMMRLATAAAVLLAVLIGARSGWLAHRRVEPGGEPPQVATAIDPDELSSALAEATSATWDLARATSAPAARVGLEVLDVAEFSETSASLTLPDEVDPTEVLRDVGERVNEGVRPLSGTARHAFGFLLGAPEVPPPPARGA